MEKRDPAGLKSTERGAIILRPLDGIPETLVPPVSLPDDGTVELQHVPAGRYMLLFRAAQTIYVSAARFVALDVIAKPFDVMPLRMALFYSSSASPEALSRARSWTAPGKPPPKRPLFSFHRPISAPMIFPSRLRPPTLKADCITGIRPGNYTVFAITDKPGPATHLTPLNYGMHIEVGKDQHILQDLKQIPRQ